MHYFDTHAHIGLIIEDPIDQLIITQEAKRDGVSGIISICNNLIDFFEVHKNLISASNVFHAVGVSPSEIERPGKNWEAQIVEGAALKNVVAIGETGLDYYRVGNRTKQVELFIRQLELAESLGLPVIIHNREAGTDILDILNSRMPSRGAVLHCFSEDWDFAEKALELSENLYISFAGNVTYRNAKKLQEAAFRMPLERMLIETESPFMIPTAYREKKRTRPSYIHSIVEYIAHLRQEERETIARATFENACRFFGLNLTY
jgi:TatD DNase family protein